MRPENGSMRVVSGIQPTGDLHRTHRLLPAQMHDLALNRLRGPCRAVRRTARPVTEHRASHRSRRRVEHLPVTLRPPVRGRPAHPVVVGRLRHRPAAIHHKPAELETSFRSQSSVSVGHEDLLVVWRFLDSSTPRQGGLHLQRSISACHHTSSTNVPGQYN